MNVKIKDLPVEERPMERLLMHGVENLSNEDLLAVVLKTGTKDASVKSLASQILATLNNISELQDKKYSQLLKIKGIGPSKATLLIATIELGKRISNKSTNIYNQKADTPQAIFDYYALQIGHKKQEHFYAIYLDNQKKIIEDKLLFIGTINRSLIHPQNIFKEAYLLDASAIICVHNHPSGNIMPSLEDIKVTKQLSKIGELFGIKVIDHIIVSESKYYSFFENGDIS